MKQKLLRTVMLILCTLMLLSACNYSPNSGSNNNSNLIVTQGGEVVNLRYSTVKNTNSTKYDLTKSYYDDNYYYYYFHLGRIDNVPLQAANEVDYHHYVGNYYTKEFETSKTTSNSVENACSNALTYTTTLTSTKEINAGIGIKVTSSLEAGLSGNILSVNASVSKEFNANLEKGYSRTTGKTETTSRTDSYKQIATESETNIEKTKFEFTSESKIGYYRYIMTGSVEVYTAVVYSIADDTYYIKTLTEVVSHGYSFDYSTSPMFDDNDGGKLEFNYSIINDLEPPTEPLNTATGDLPVEDLPIEDLPDDPSKNFVVEKPNLYSDTTTYLIHDTGVYGLANKNYETINLSEYSNYFNENYLFCFAVTLNVSKVDDGYQEIYLYGDNTFTSKDVEISTAIATYGLVRGSVMTHGSGAYDHNIYWNVSGKEFKELQTKGMLKDNKVYIRYDASGNNDDDWNKNKISVGLTVVGNSEPLPMGEIVLNNENPITVTDSGVFGLAARSHEQMDLSAYSEYMQSDYIFMFDVSINLQEKDDGYQEIYLYNKFDITTSDGKKNLAFAREHGLLWGTTLEYTPGKANKTPGDVHFNWVISGESIRKTNGDEGMFIRYDAHGDDADTWYKNSITVTLHIFNVPTHTVDDSVLDVII